MLAALTNSMSRRRDLAITRHRAVGFTLIELMVTVAVAVILAMVAVPSFRQFILNQRLKNASYDLVSALTLARSEAITRNASVNLIAIGGSWAGGWCVTTTDCTAPIISHEAFNASIGIDSYLAGTTNAGPTTITYGSSGRATTAAATLAVVSATAVTGVQTRCVSISLIGVPRTSSSSSRTCS